MLLFAVTLLFLETQVYCKTDIFMKLFLQKIFGKWSNNGLKSHLTATSTTSNTSSFTAKSSSKNSFLFFSGSFLLGSFFETFQKKSNSLFKLIELGHYQRFKTTTLGVLALGLFFVVVQIRDRGGHGSSSIRKTRDYDSFLAISLLDINSNDYN